MNTYHLSDSALFVYSISVRQFDNVDELHFAELLLRDTEIRYASTSV